MIWFRFAKDGRDIPVYFRKEYKKTRYKRASERLAPGYWNSCVVRGISMCKYDEAFTAKEMLEETGRCKICKLNCPMAGKEMADVYSDE